MGNTVAHTPRSRRFPVHPHTRGEHLVEQYTGLIDTGSSPHTWGTPSDRLSCKFHVRFIPTHVGNTLPSRLLSLYETVHPHTRGEHRKRRDTLIMPLGSSPHTWGTRGYQKSEVSRGRFIPTHVGNTASRYQPPRMISVHPHTRGEHCRQCVHGLVRIGSSPHTWGTPLPPDAETSPARFIPTHVGNTRACARCAW